MESKSNNEQISDEESLPALQSTFDRELFMTKVMEPQEFLYDKVMDKSQKRYVSELCDSMSKLTGSRSFCWRLNLGLLPSISSSNRKVAWVKQT